MRIPLALWSWCDGKPVGIMQIIVGLLIVSVAYSQGSGSGAGAGPGPEGQSGSALIVSEIEEENSTERTSSDVHDAQNRTASGSTVQATSSGSTILTNTGTTATETELEIDTSSASLLDSQSGSIQSTAAPPHQSPSAVASVDDAGQAASDSTIVTEQEPTTPPKVLISEILANPVGSDTHEWIEIRNDDDRTVDITGFILRDENKAYTLGPHENGSGRLLRPGEHLVFDKSVTKISLKNTGEKIELLSGSLLLDSLEYPEALEGMSYGRSMGASPQDQYFCSPSENLPNSDEPITVSIERQSGETYGVGSVAINLEAVSQRKSLKASECRWDYGDGFYSDKCNPPSHTFKQAGSFAIKLHVDWVCGVVSRDSITVVVDEEKVEAKNITENERTSSDVHDVDEKKSEIDMKNSNSNSSAKAEKDVCSQTSTDGIIISEFLPNPTKDESTSEWIELRNTTDKRIDLCGWSLDDAEKGSKAFSLDGKLIEEDSFLILFRKETKIALNNSNDSVRLFAGDNLVDQVAYGKSVEGQSYALGDSGDFQWTGFVTPGQKNINLSSVEIGATVQRVIDGDTIEVVPLQTVPWLTNDTSSNSSSNSKREMLRIRLLGIDAPETVHPDKGVEEGGPEASAFLRELLEGQEVTLTFDERNTRDVYDRILAYVWLEDRLVQRKLIEGGFALVEEDFPFARMEEFLGWQEESGPGPGSGPEVKEGGTDAEVLPSRSRNVILPALPKLHRSGGGSSSKGEIAASDATASDSSKLEVSKQESSSSNKPSNQITNKPESSFLFQTYRNIPSHKTSDPDPHPDPIRSQLLSQALASKEEGPASSHTDLILVVMLALQGVRLIKFS